jgi:hypothetical protein
MTVYFKERRKEMKKNLFSFYVIVTVIGLTIIFLFPAHGKTECDPRDLSRPCILGDPNLIKQHEGTAVESAALAGQATLISPSGETFDATPTYTWTAVTDATWYHIWINRGTGTLGEKWYTAAEVGCPSGTGNCSLTAPAALAPGTYTWWIQAWYNAYGPWSDGKPFYVDPTGKNCQKINAVGFVPTNSAITYNIYLAAERYRTGGTGVFGISFDAPVNLPVGAQITNVFLDYYDSNVTYDVCFYIWDNHENVAIGYSNCSSGAPGYGQVQLDLTNSNYIVDNVGRNYSISVGLGAPDISNRFRDVLICYKPIP